MKTPPLPKIKQPLPEDVLAALLGFIETKFYPGFRVAFEKDKPRLIDWVIRAPARWLYGRGVTLPPARYREILEGVLMDALDHGDFGAIKYLPGYLRCVIERHLAGPSGDRIYDEAKAVRRVSEGILMVLGPGAQRDRDVVAELAKMNSLQKAARRQKTAVLPRARQRELF